MKLALSIIMVIVLVAGGAAYYTVYVAAETPTNFLTVTVNRDDLLSTISATGTVEPEEVVDVGAQVVGRIKDFGIDPSELKGRKSADIDPQELAKMKRIDYGSVVHEDTELAYIDDAVYKAQVDQAKAAYIRSQADLKQMQAKLLQTERDRKRAEELRSIKDIPGTDRPIKGIADSDYDLAVANNEVAKANVAVGEATIVQNKAALDMSKTNWDYCFIKSPVEGVIVARRVNIGQTVAGGSLNTPSMFLIAKDLSKMQVWASVNEADIGKIRTRQDMPVQFTVDAYPGEVFRGKVAQIHLDANSTQNVVTYTVVVAFDNSNLKLIPYLTANLQFEIDQRKDVLLVPNAAVRWKPRPEQIVPELREKMASALGGRSGDRDPQNASASLGGARPVKQLARGREDRGRLWVKDGKFVRPVDIQIGSTDGTQTEISGDEVKEGMKVVRGESKSPELADSGDTTNPFAPRIFRSGGGRGGR
ncbi:MAG: HlyD family efflux transporter periplasmic adaptor subunit [Thermoguttaceae bacterium]|jgi:HlyD family secretion protein